MKSNKHNASIRGNALVITMITITVMAAMVGAGMQLTSMNTRNSERTTQLLSAKALAEGALEIAFAQWQRYLEKNVNYTVTNPPSSDDLKFINASYITSHPTFSGYFNDATLDELSAKAADENGEPVDDESAPPVGHPPPDGSGTGAFQQTPQKNYGYRVTAQVTRRTAGGPVTARISRVFELIHAPLSIGAIFNDSEEDGEESPLEIHNSPPMYVFGRVHSNPTTYACPEGSGILYFYRPVSSAGNWIHGYDPDDHREKRFDPKYLADASSGPKSNAPRVELVGINPNQIIKESGTTPNTQGKLRELIERPVTGVEDPAQISDRRLYNQADVKVLIDTTKPVDDANRVQVLLKSGSAPDNVRNAVLNNIVGYTGSGTSAHYTNRGTTFYNTREGTVDFVTDVRIGPMSKAVFKEYKAAKGETFNGVLYIADVSTVDSSGNVITTNDSSGNPVSSASSTPIYNASKKKWETKVYQKAIRLIDGESLVQPSDPGTPLKPGLTVVTDNALYLQGNYNTGDNPPAESSGSFPGSDDVQNNTSKYQNYTEGGSYNRIPAMVAADALMLLSNSWNDANAASSSSSTPTANHTAYNTAMISGNTPTTADSGYSGGIENYPRFLENWSGKRCAIYGSINQLYSSKAFKGDWKDQKYSPPDRIWYFDRNYESDPPRGIVAATSTHRGIWVGFETIY